MAAGGGKDGGRANLDWFGICFLRDCYENEDKARLHWWLRTKKSREAAAAETGESKTIQVMRNKIMSAVPHPGGYYNKVLDMKPANYRHREPPDPTESRLHETIDRLGLFSDPTLTATMYPVPEDVHRALYDGVSRDGEGRLRYIEKRHRMKPELKFRFPPTTSQYHGFRQGDFISVRDMAKKPEHVRRSVIDDTFFTKNGFFETHIHETHQLLPWL